MVDDPAYGEFQLELEGNRLHYWHGVEDFIGEHDLDEEPYRLDFQILGHYETEADRVPYLMREGMSFRIPVKWRFEDWTERLVHVRAVIDEKYFVVRWWDGGWIYHLLTRRHLASSLERGEVRSR